MTLPAAPPRYASWKQMLSPIVQGDTGWPVYGLTRGIKASPKPENLGSFTIGLKRAVKRWQANHDLTADGVAGPMTQGTILLLASKGADEGAGLPGGTMFGFCVWEGGSVLAATNWNSPGGVDCGPAQWRLAGPPFSMDRLRFAFDPWKALSEAATGLRKRQVDYMALTKGEPWKFTARRALEVAALYHNWQVGAAQIVDYGHVLSPDAIAEWTVKTVDEHGNVVERYTRGEWASEYPRRVLSFSLP